MQRKASRLTRREACAFLAPTRNIIVALAKSAQLDTDHDGYPVVYDEDDAEIRVDSAIAGLVFLLEKATPELNSTHLQSLCSQITAQAPIYPEQVHAALHELNHAESLLTGYPRDALSRALHTAQITAAFERMGLAGNQQRSAT